MPKTFKTPPVATPDPRIETLRIIQEFADFIQIAVLAAGMTAATREKANWTEHVAAAMKRCKDVEVELRVAGVTLPEPESQEGADE